MESSQTQADVRDTAEKFGGYVGAKNVEAVISCFAEDCEIEFLNVKLKGKHGAGEWIKWLYGHMSELRYEPVFTMSDGNVFFVEYVLVGKLHNGIDIKSRQAQIMIFDSEGRIKHFRYYFDRLDFVESAINRIMAKSLVQIFNQKTLNDLSKYAC